MAKAKLEDKAGHVTRGNVLKDLGFTTEEIRETEIKMTLWRPLRAEIEARGLTQAQVADSLQIHQPDASLLVRGRLEKFSVMKLMQFAERLGLAVRLVVKPVPSSPSGRTRNSRPSPSSKGQTQSSGEARAREKLVA